MPANKVDVVCVGVITMDTIALVDRYPSEDERVLAQEIARGGEDLLQLLQLLWHV